MSNARYSIFAARAVFDVENVTATELRVLAALGTYTNDEGWCYPNQTTLAERLKLTRQTISGAIKKLVEKGYIEKEVRTAKGRGKVGYNYRVILDLKRAAALPKADDKEADIGEGRQRPQPTSAPAEFGADHDPMSAQASVPYKELTNPTERTQPSCGKGDLFGGEPEKPAAKSKALKPAGYTKDFEAIWLSWPKNRRMSSDKRKAFERYKTGVATFGAEDIAAAARRYLSLPDTRKENSKYCCAVEVFMNGKLEAAVEAAREEATPTESITHEDAKRLAAQQYFKKTGKRPPNYTGSLT